MKERSLTTEQLARVFGERIGQPYLVCYNIEGAAVIQIEPITINDIEPDIENKRDLLLLTPLEKISDEDLLECFLVGKPSLPPGCTPTVEAEQSRRMIRIAGVLVSRFIKYPHELSMERHRYLIQKGYDVPMFFGIDHPDNGRTLIELGIAIDRTAI